MELYEYLDGITASERRRFADRCGLNLNYLSQLACYHRMAGPKSVIAIPRESGGAVPAETLRPDLHSTRKFDRVAWIRRKKAAKARADRRRREARKAAA